MGRNWQAEVEALREMLNASDRRKADLERRAEQAEAACAAMNAAIEHFLRNKRWTGQGYEVSGQQVTLLDMASVSPGKGWHSPDEWEQQDMTISNLRLQLEDTQGALAAMREALEECLNALLTYRGVSVVNLVEPDQRVLDHARKALASDAGREAAALLEAAVNWVEQQAALEDELVGRLYEAADAYSRARRGGEESKLSTL